jgi:hypothetical protein
MIFCSFKIPHMPPAGSLKVLMPSTTYPPALICGFSGGKKNITFFFGRNIAHVKIVP